LLRRAFQFLPAETRVRAAHLNSDKLGTQIIGPPTLRPVRGARMPGNSLDRHVAFIRRACANGMTNAAIAAELGTSAYLVAKFIKRRRMVRNRPRSMRYPGDDREPE
jgi:hypothetical protein